MSGHPGRRDAPILGRPGIAALSVVLGMTASGWALAAAAPAVPIPPPAGELRLASEQCRRCHQSIYDVWRGSHHALANRPVTAVDDAAAFVSGPPIAVGEVRYEVEWRDDHAMLAEFRGGRPPQRYSAAYVIGYRPLRQYVVPIGDGRLQAAELAYDAGKRRWFGVFGPEARQPEDWGSWHGRGMNWNSMCAQCHMTGFHRNYRGATDTYASTWLEQGIGCVQCHGDITPDHLQQAYEPQPKHAVTPSRADAHRATETCAPCHARNELLTGAIHPGGAYADQYRVVLPVDPDVFYPDGQIESEDYDWTSFLLSRMGGHAGVTCLDCHDPHSGRTVLPADNNQLCLQCHATGRLGAPMVDPTAHSHHAADSIGNRCIECHMPTSTFMQIDPRHDHGFLHPDPLLTQELGIPNACNRCHQDRGVAWAIEATDSWYGAKMDSRQRQRARVVAAARQRAPGAGSVLAGLIRKEDIPTWRATLLMLARPYLNREPSLVREATAALADPDANVRSAAVQVLATQAGDHPELRPLLKDPVKLVRLDAEWTLSPALAAGSPERIELDAYLAAHADQPTGQLRLGEDLFNRGALTSAEAHLRKAAAWDPNSAVIGETLGLVLNAQGRAAEAGDLLWHAAALDPTNATPAFEAGLAYAAAGQASDAEKALRMAVNRDPRFDRAWYDLGLLLARSGRHSEAADALRQAAAIAPDVAAYPYALATVEVQSGDRRGAARDLARVLVLDPNNTRARALLEELAGAAQN